MKFSRHWAMPSGETFDIEPIALFVRRYLNESRVSIDPFARDKQWATHTNDINPKTKASYHYDAEEFMKILAIRNVKADLLIFDPPYSPRQISECYAESGLTVGMADTQNAALYKRVRDAAMPVLANGAIVLSFGWNSSGMGQERGFQLKEILMVCHGGAHNDTICTAESMVQSRLDL